MRKHSSDKSFFESKKAKQTAGSIIAAGALFVATLVIDPAQCAYAATLGTAMLGVAGVYNHGQSKVDAGREYPVER